MTGWHKRRKGSHGVREITSNNDDASLSPAAGLLEGPGPAGPYVLQCEKCKTILGDSTLVAYRHQGWAALALSGCSSVSLASSTEREAFGPEYFALNCLHCQERVGRQYVDLTPLEGLFVLFSSHVARRARRVHCAFSLAFSH